MSKSLPPELRQSNIKQTQTSYWSSWKARINPNWALIVGMLVLGMLMVMAGMIFSYTHDPNSKKDLWYDYAVPLLEKIGVAILSAGFFAAFLKSFQFIGVFREEIKKVITSDDVLVHSRNELSQFMFSQEHLKNLTEKARYEAWQNATKSLCDWSIPEIEKEFLEKLRRFYVPEKVDYIMRDFEVRYEIRKVPGGIELSESISYKIISPDPKTEIRASYVIVKPNQGVGSVDIKNFKIDGKDYKDHFQQQVEDFPELKGFSKLKNAIKIDFQKKEHKVQSYVIITMTTEISPHWRHIFSKFTKGCTIDVINRSPDDIDFKLELTDERLDLDQILLNLPNHKRIEELLLPTDGYLIVITPKIWN